MGVTPAHCSSFVNSSEGSFQEPHILPLGSVAVKMKLPLVPLTPAHLRAASEQPL